MTDENEERCYPPLEELDREEVEELLEAIHDQNHVLINELSIRDDAAKSVGYALHVMSGNLSKVSVLNRKTMLAVASAQLEMMSSILFAATGVTSEDLEQAEQFADIVENFDETAPEDRA